MKFAKYFTLIYSKLVPPIKLFLYKINLLEEHWVSHHLKEKIAMPTDLENLNILLKKNSKVKVLTGKNNSGKTRLLRNLNLRLGSLATHIGCSRFYHPQDLRDQAGNAQNLKKNVVRQMSDALNSDTNSDNNSRGDINQILCEFTDQQIEKLIEVAFILGFKIDIRKKDENKRFSPHILCVDNIDIKKASTGTRLLIYLLSVLIDKNFQVILIDEPELGLSPNLQQKVVSLIFDPEVFNFHFPHIESIYITTHSHIFLNNNDFSSNFIVSREDNSTSLTQLKSTKEYNKLIWDMMGNSLNSLFLPEAVVIVEGETDESFLNKVFKQIFPNNIIGVSRAYGGDGQILDKVSFLANTINIEDTFLFERTFIIVDSENTVNKERLFKKGIKENNFIEWSKNGIEYFYPEKTLTKALNNETTSDDITLNPADKNQVIIHGNQMTKRIFEQKISDELDTVRITVNDFNEEFKSKLLNPLLELLK